MSTGFVLITVALDSRGAETAGEWIRAAGPEHPSLLDPEYTVARRYNLVNVPSGVWIDERGRIVRPPEVAFVTNRWKEFTRSDSEAYVNGLRDWVRHGDGSRFALSPREVRERLTLPTEQHALAAANFRMGEYLHGLGFPEDAVAYFKAAQALHPEHWGYKRQAWQLTDAEKYYGTSFQAEVKKLGGRSYYTPLDLPR